MFFFFLYSGCVDYGTLLKVALGGLLHRFKEASCVFASYFLHEYAAKLLAEVGIRPDPQIQLN